MDEMTQRVIGWVREIAGGSPDLSIMVTAGVDEPRLTILEGGFHCITVGREKLVGLARLEVGQKEGVAEHLVARLVPRLTAEYTQKMRQNWNRVCATTSR